MKFIETPSHGYLKITPMQLKEAMARGFVPTHYSYISKKSVLLEEDVDAYGFMQIMGIDFNTIQQTYQIGINKNCYNRLTEELCNYVMNHMFCKNVIGV